MLAFQILATCHLLTIPSVKEIFPRTSSQHFFYLCFLLFYVFNYNSGTFGDMKLKILETSVPFPMCQVLYTGKNLMCIRPQPDGSISTLI